MRYDVILWDVDDTLLDFTYSMEYALIKALEEAGIRSDREVIDLYAKINESWWKRLERGEVTKPELLVGRFIQLFEELEVKDVDPQAFRLKFQDYLGSVYRYIDDSIEICRQIKAKGRCRQYAVTNGVTVTQVSKLKASGFADVFDDLFISEQIGVPKPQKGFFDRVLETIGEVPKGRILIVGDSLSSDMRGGNRAEIDTCWYNPHDEINTTEVETTYIIRNLKEVLQILEG